MSSHSHNSASTRRLRRTVIRTAILLALFAGYVVGRPLFDVGPEVDSPAPAEPSSDGTAAEWTVDIRPDAGFPTQVRPGVFQSPAGLIYGRGSAEGTRLNHVMRHSKDDPDRPIHGVFEENREGILALLDEAYMIALKRGPPVDVEQDGPRTVYTIDMGRRVGYVGGEAGARNGHPAATHIRLVLEEHDVITAFPLRP